MRGGMAGCKSACPPLSMEDSPPPSPRSSLSPFLPQSSPAQRPGSRSCRWGRHRPRRLPSCCYYTPSGSRVSRSGQSRPSRSGYWGPARAGLQSLSQLLSQAAQKARWAFAAVDPRRRGYHRLPHRSSWGTPVSDRPPLFFSPACPARSPPPPALRRGQGESEREARQARAACWLAGWLADEGKRSGHRVSASSSLPPRPSVWCGREIPRF